MADYNVFSFFVSTVYRLTLNLINYSQNLYKKIILLMFLYCSRKQGCHYCFEVEFKLQCTWLQFQKGEKVKKISCFLVSVYEKS